MSKDPDRDDLEEAADVAFDLLDKAMDSSGADKIEPSIENEEVPIAGGDEVDGVEIEFDEDEDVDDPRATCRCQVLHARGRTPPPLRRPV